MAITDWPLAERPREKLLRLGANALSNAELLAIFLQTGTKGKTAIDLARDLLNEYKTLSALFNASKNQIAAKTGMGHAKYSMLQAAVEMGKRYFGEELKQKPKIAGTAEAKKYLIAKLAHYKQEVFSCIFLNSCHQIIKYEELFHGTIHTAPIYPRVIAQKALEYNASAIICAHNHPSGNTRPSQNDIQSTQDLITVLNYLDIQVLDHIVVGGNKCTSFSEKKLL